MKPWIATRFSFRAFTGSGIWAMLLRAAAAAFSGVTGESLPSKLNRESVSKPTVTYLSFLAGRLVSPTAAAALVPGGRVEARPNGVEFVARAALVVDDGPPIGSPRIIGACAGAPIVLPKAARRPAVIENKV